MPPKRHFLDWQQPALLSAVAYLREKYAANRDWDLSGLIVVVPARRAGRRLLELLVFEARERRLRFSPPTLTTEGGLPEMLYRPKHAFADALTQDLAWAQALQRLPDERLKAIVPFPPGSDDSASWLKLGQILRVRHTELSADTLLFSDIVKFGPTLPNFPDGPRWEAMAAAQDIYLRTLDDLQLWDIQTARLVAIERQEFATEREILLLGTVDLTRTLRKILDQVADRVTALVVAPPSYADRFDGYGCVVPEAWQQAELPIRDEQILRVAGPADQADAVAKVLASYGGKYRSDQITLGVPDERLVPHLQRQLEQCAVPVRWVQGKRLPETEPYRLLQAVADFLREETTQSFAALVRHPDVFARLTAGPQESCVAYSVIDEMDRLAADYLVTRLAPRSWPHEVRRKIDQGTDFLHVVRAAEQLGQWIAPLRARPQRLSQWSQPILSVLQALYADHAENPNTLAALEEIQKALQTQMLLPERLDPKLAAAEAIAWTLAQLRPEAIAPPAQEEAIEMLGWFELMLDDAPALVLTTFNEGFVPESTGDSFLPNSIRKPLGLIDNDRRYARDAFYLSAILASRESVHLISARRDAEENPLAPSRLLFAADAQRVVDRARTFFKPLDDAPPRLPLIGAGLPVRKRSQLYVPRPQELAVLDRLRVTQFRDYLACPYRFYLRHVLELGAADDTCQELQANAFGNLIHKVLESFGASPAMHDCRNEDDIFEFLREELHRCVRQRYGDEHRLAALEIQVEQIRARLYRFARWQAKRTGQGWRIVFSETTEEETATDGKGGAAAQQQSRRDRDAEVLVDGVPIRLGGRIDRIDQNADGTLMIFDYKTGDGADPPERTHRRKKEWVDLQLPLYRHLARAWGFEGTMQLGYILIPKALEEIGDSVADWTADDLASADETMHEVVRRIRRAEFWPPAKPPDYPDDYMALCQDRRLGGRLFDEELSPEARS
jgi:ATP-dependent helicase/nuclease subunit B